MRKPSTGDTSMWIYKGQPIYNLSHIPADFKGAYGIIYMLRGSNGKFYVGQKQFFSTTRKTVSQKQLDLRGKSAFRRKKVKKGKKAGEWVYYETIKKETDWVDYMGSSEELKKDIKNGITFEKEILEFVPRKGLMLYKETKAILCNDCLENDNCYNRHAMNKFYTNNIVRDNGEDEEE